MLLSRKLLCELSPNFSKVSDDHIRTGVMNMGMEVEQIIHHPKLENICVGEIIKVEKHPNADKLNVAEVLISEKPRIVKTIVCGANNLFVGQKAVVAMVGAKLYDGREIGEKTLQGITSCGMLCGYSELTPYNHESMSDSDKSGIITLDSNAKVGDTNIASFLGLDDTIYDLSIPSNRHDWQSVLLLVEDMSKFFGFKSKLQINETIKSDVKNIYKLSIDPNISSCGTMYVIDEYITKQSPWNLRATLLNSGVELVSQTIDNINYISLLTGVSPLLFDADKLPKNLIQKMGNGEKVIVKNKPYTLTNKDAILVDDKGVVLAIDNIRAVDDYAVTHLTKKIVVYISNTKHDLVRNTITRHNLSSKSGKNNSKRNCGYQMSLFNNMLLKGYGKKVISACSNKIALEKDKTIKCSMEELVRFNGIESENPVEFAIKSLEKLGYTVKGDTVIVPGYRNDLENDQDIFEEVLKVYGVNELPIKPYTAPVDLLYKEESNYSKLHEIKKILINDYICETKTYNLTSKENANVFNFFNLKPFYHLNPCTNKAREYIRTNLVSSLLSVFAFNLNRKNELQPIFEMQKIFTEEVNTNLTILSPEKYVLDPINNVVLNFNTTGLKAIAVQIAQHLGIKLDIEIINDCPYLYANDALKISYKGKTVGYIGCIRQKMLKPYKINEELYVLTLNLEDLLKDKNLVQWKVKDLDQNIPVYKDITFNATKNTNIFAILKSLDNLLVIKDYSFIKAYKLSENEIAYTIRFIVANNNYQNLTKQEIDETIKAVVDIIIANKAEIKGI